MIISSLPKVFLSYSTQDKILAGSIKDCLERIGFDVFLAHSSLDISDTWREIIKKELHEREVFIVLLTPNAKPSDWVDQEIGIAIAKGKTIACLQAPTLAYGFAAEFQAVSLDPENIWFCMGVVVRGITKKHPVARDPFRQGIIKQLRHCTSFQEARDALAIIQELSPPLSKRERLSIFLASQKNSQIGGYSEVRRFVSQLDTEFFHASQRGSHS